VLSVQRSHVSRFGFGLGREAVLTRPLSVKRRRFPAEVNHRLDTQIGLSWGSSVSGFGWSADEPVPDQGIACLVLVLGFHQTVGDGALLRHARGKSGPSDAGDIVRLGRRMGAGANLRRS